MQYIKFKNGYILKLDSGEEIISSLKNFVSDNKIKGAFLFGIGAGNEITLGYYDPEKRTYHKRFFADDHEFASITGNISYLENDPVIHIHCTISPQNFITYSGHLFSGKVGATCEIMIVLSDKKLVRKPDAKTGLNLLNLDSTK